MTDKTPLPGERQKLVETKERWAREQQHQSGHRVAADRPRIPPGQHEVKDWPVLDLGIQPRVTTANWELEVKGRVECPLRWSWIDFMAQPQMRDVSDMHCVTSWSRLDNEWLGVAARHIIAQARPLNDVRHVLLHSYDGYTTNLRMADFDDEDVILAHTWQGTPIASHHGGPVRLIVPKIYLWKSAKWLKCIEFLAQDQPGYWEVRGYHNEGDPWREERYSG